jgi:hypothetical protein
VSRDKIKIIEFGMDQDSPSPTGASGSGLVKIKEFGDDRAEARTRAATAKDIGPIKIIEFDDGPQTRKPKPQAAPPAKAGKRVGPVKIKAFDEEREAEVSIGGAPKIKIMEFD